MSNVRDLAMREMETLFKNNKCAEKQGTCVVCFDEKTVVSLSCHDEHVLCKDCALEIFLPRCDVICPCCREREDMYSLKRKIARMEAKKMQSIFGEWVE